MSKMVGNTNLCVLIAANDTLTDKQALRSQSRISVYISGRVFKKSWKFSGVLPKLSNKLVFTNGLVPYFLSRILRTACMT
jgi:hypothetical protein